MRARNSSSQAVERVTISTLAQTVLYKPSFVLSREIEEALF